MKCQNQHKRHKLGRWSDTENASFNTGFIWHSILVKQMSISVQNCKIMFSGLPTEEIFLHNTSAMEGTYKRPLLYRHRTSEYIPK